MIFIKCEVAIKNGKDILLFYEKIDIIIEILKCYFNLKTLEDKELEYSFRNYFSLNFPNVRFTYKDYSEVFDKKTLKNTDCAIDLNHIFIKVNIEDNIKKFEKIQLKNSIQFILEATEKLDLYTFVEVKKLNKIEKHCESELYIRTVKYNNINLNIEKLQKSINLKVFIPNTQDLKISIISPSRFKVQDIRISKNEKSFIIENTKVKVDIVNQSQVNINLRSDDFIERGNWKLNFNELKELRESACMGNSFLLKSERGEVVNKLEERDFPKTYIESNEFEPVFVIYYHEEDEEKLKNLENIFKFYKLSDGFGIIYIRKDRIRDLGQIYSFEYIYRMQRYIKMVQLTSLSRGIEGGYTANEEIGANYFKTHPNLNIDGKGVIISIINSGINYLHPDFIYPDGTSKILYLWDQTKDGKPPEGFSIGTEYTRDDINKAIAENNPNLSTDEEGIGTALGGICSGLGNANKNYPGVAEGADLIVVKLKKIDGFYNNATFLSGIDYSYKKAKGLDRPIVQNITLGSNNQPSPGISFMSKDSFYEFKVCEVVGAGNEGSGRTHTMGKINFPGEIKDIEVEIADYEEEVEIDVWVNRPDKLTVLIISPSGHESKTAFVSNLNILEGLFDFENTYYTMWSTYPVYYTGQQATLIRLKGASKGVWKIRLIGDTITNGIFHAYLPNHLLLKPGTKFREGNPNYTLTYPSVYSDCVAVGTYNSLNSSIWSESSRGPVIGTIGRIERPDLVAPGVNIIAPYENNNYALVSGSGVASSYTAGSVALIMQFILFKENYKDKAVVQKIKTYLRAGAKRDSKINYPDVSYGYGNLDIKGTFEEIR